MTALLARDGYVPRQFMNLGDRLVYSTGTVVLAALAALLLAAFAADPNRLIHLYLLGVFVAFTLSQAGMVRRWRRDAHCPGSARARAHLGAGATAVVALLVLATKFTEGAWVVVIVVPALVWMFARTGRRRAALAARLAADPGRTSAAIRVRPVLLVEHLDEAVVEALAYVRSIAAPGAEALHVRGSATAGSDLSRRWTSLAGEGIDPATSPPGGELAQRPRFSIETPIHTLGYQINSGATSASRSWRLVKIWKMWCSARPMMSKTCSM